MLLRLVPPALALPLRLAGAGSFRHRVGPVELLVREAGPEGGEPWVLLHGLGSTSLSWYWVYRALGDECRMLAPELSELGGTRCPGHGLNVLEGVAAVGDLIERRFPDRKVTVAGISLGGWIATRLAIERPERVARLVLVDAAGYRNQDWDRIRSLVEVESLDDLDRLYGALFHRTPWLLSLVRPGFYLTYRSPAVRHVLETISPEEAFGERELGRLQLPVCLVWGARDGLFTLDVAWAMEAALPDAELHILPECGHAAQWECPQAMIEAFRSFRHRTGRGELTAAAAVPG